MKELTIVEKAKAYDEALEKLRGMIPNWERLSYNGNTFLQDLIHIFPQLQESEDERMRKDIIATIHLYYGEPLEDEAKEMIAWLEKQGEQKSIDELTQQEAMDIAVAKCFEQGEQKLVDDADDEAEKYAKTLYCSNLEAVIGIGNCSMCENVKDAFKAGLEKQDESIDPKFKIGDWIIRFCGKIYHILDIVDSKYYVEDYNGEREYIYIANSDIYKLWTIKDAKPGDVLATDDGGICVFDGTVEEGKYPFAYCGLTVYGFESYDRKLPFTHDDVHPATKEQRDTLFAKIKEAGYEWDAEKKELRKLSHSKVTKISDQVQKPAECRQETKPNGGIIYEDFNEGDGSYKVNLAYLSKSQVELIENIVDSWQNHANNSVELSEEDIRNIENIDSVLFYDKDLPEDTCVRLRNWLKSLKQRIGG